MSWDFLARKCGDVYMAVEIVTNPKPIKSISNQKYQNFVKKSFFIMNFIIDYRFYLYNGYNFVHFLDNSVNPSRETECGP